LLAAKLINRKQIETVQEMSPPETQNKKILGYVLQKTEAETVKFLEALSNNLQQHVVNFLLDVTGR